MYLLGFLTMLKLGFQTLSLKYEGVDTVLADIYL